MVERLKITIFPLNVSMEEGTITMRMKLLVSAKLADAAEDGAATEDVVGAVGTALAGAVGVDGAGDHPSE